MGSAIAGRLMKGGEHLTVWNRSPAAGERLVADEAARARTPAGAIAGRGRLLDAGRRRGVRGDAGRLRALAPPAKGLVLVNCATVSVALAERLEAMHRELGLAYVAAPVLGR